jgi:hypothetical protein
MKEEEVLSEVQVLFLHINDAEVVEVILGGFLTSKKFYKLNVRNLQF